MNNMAQYKEKKPWAVKIRSYNRLSMKKRALFFKHVSAMIEAGVPIEKGLKAIHAQTKSRTLHLIIHNLLKDLSSGEDLSSSFQRMSHIFDPLSVNLISVGEKTGTLGPSMLRAATYYEKTIILRNKVLSTLLYPLIVIFGTVGTVIYLVFVLLPQILPLFTALNVQLPLATRVVISTADFLTKNGVLLLGAIAVAIGIFILLLRIPSVRYLISAAILKIPVISTLVKKTQMARLAYMIGVLISAGVTIVQAFKIAAESMEHPVYKKALHEAGLSLREGESISYYLNKRPDLFSLFATQMIIVGEETGKLGESFAQVSQFTEREIDDAVKVLTTLLEPTLMIVIGFIVGFVALAVIMPIYELTAGVGATY